MNNKFATRLISICFFLFSIASEAVAQYEQKATIQASAGTSIIVSSYPNEDLFGPGLMFNGGLQYNFNRQFSLIGLAMYGQYSPSKDINIVGDFDVTYFNLGVGVSAKYKFLPTSKYRPYLLLGVTACFVRLEVGPIIREQPVLPGLVTGLGAEIDLNDNLTLFGQAGFNKILPKPDDGLSPTESVYFLLGVNLNMFKSKSL
jgi:hypothetical protein